MLSLQRPPNVSRGSLLSPLFPLQGTAIPSQTQSQARPSRTGPDRTTTTTTSLHTRVQKYFIPPPLPLMSTVPSFNLPPSFLPSPARLGRARSPLRFPLRFRRTGRTSEGASRSFGPRLLLPLLGLGLGLAQVWAWAGLALSRLLLLRPVRDAVRYSTRPRSHAPPPMTWPFATGWHDRPRVLRLIASPHCAILFVYKIVRLNGSLKSLRCQIPEIGRLSGRSSVSVICDGLDQ